MELKKTGVVRRIDDLGRIVIPKEFRRRMRIQEGDPLDFAYVTAKGSLGYCSFRIERWSAISRRKGS